MDDQSVSDSASSAISTIKPKAIEYLNKGRQQNETVRDFIQNSRKILMAQISINDKNEETQLLREYILMEKDKLDDGRKTFKEDKSKFEKYKMSLQAKSNATELEISNMIQANERLQVKINDKKKEEA